MMKNNDYNLYLDMDGVLVDFEGGYKKSILDKSTTTGLNLDETLEFWENLEWIHGGRELWEASKELFAGIYILSSSGTRDPDKGKVVEQGKRRWINNNMPDMNQSNVFIVGGRHLKKQKATKNSILVDDIGDTIQQWNASGGYGILHDHRHYLKTIETLQDISLPLTLNEIIKRSST